MFKNIVQIYKQDMKKIFTNYAAIIVFAALCILPSLYAWFNIVASWDPYSEKATSQILIGVVNLDQGSDIDYDYLNFGDKVVAELKNNQLLGWRFMSEKEANKALQEGQVYATITIPKNFSEDITSLIKSDVKSGEIIYTVNEKINAIAPKLTSKGATGVQENVNKAVIETVSEVLFETGKVVGSEMQQTVLPKLAIIYDQLDGVIAKFSEVNETVDIASEGVGKIKDLIQSIQGDIPLIQDTINNMVSLSGQVESFIKNSREGLDLLAPSLKEDLRLMSEITKEIATYASSVMDAIQSGTDKAPEMVANLITKVTSSEKLVESLINILEGFNKITPGKPLTPIINQLSGVSTELVKINDLLKKVETSLANGETPDLSLLANIVTIANNVNAITSGLYQRFDSEIAPKISLILDEASGTLENIVTVLNNAKSKIPDVQTILNLAFDGADKGIEGIAYIKEKLPEAENLVVELANKIDAVNKNEDLKEILVLLQEAVQDRINFLSNPVDLVEEVLYPMGNYGTAMTPFYSVLSLWVGATFLISMLAVHAHGSYRPVEVYFGKLLLFLTIGIIQALIVSMGDLYLLNIYCVNPSLFVAGLVFTSIVFIFIGYSLVSIAGNVGKVISIILLVLQVAGSGGTFPIQLTPHFFQVINPYLPFTYSISLAREAIGGVVQSVLIKDIVILLIFIIGAILVSIFLKKPINKLMEKFTVKYKESGIAE
ncbi:MAG: YhgE/Pip family protein [Turicibacter sp.]